MDAFDLIQNLASPTTGDVQGQGTGPSMAQRGNPGVVAVSDPTQSALVVNNADAADGNPVVAWAAVLVLLLVLKFAAEHGEDAAEFKTIKVGFYSFIVITVCAILGINAAKWFASTWKIPGVSTLVLAA